MEERKIKIPTKEQRELEQLKDENSNFWYENVVLRNDLEDTKDEMAALWYNMVLGGMN